MQVGLAVAMLAFACLARATATKQYAGRRRCDDTSARPSDRYGVACYTLTIGSRAAAIANLELVSLMPLELARDAGSRAAVP